MTQDDRKMNLWARNSFYTALGSLIIPLAAVFAFVFGIKGLRQINRSDGEQKGKTFAILGIVISGLIMISLLCIVSMVLTGPIIEEGFENIIQTMITPTP